MKNIVIGSILALAVIAFSGCSVKGKYGCSTPTYPSCAVATSCGCHR